MGTALFFFTYLGGDKKDQALDIARAPDGSFWITGQTHSDNFPQVDSIQSERNKKSDVFVSQISADGNTLLFSTYLGGKKEDRPHGIAVDNNGSAYIVGTTQSKTDFPVINALQPLFGGGSRDAFIARITVDDRNNPPLYEQKSR